MFKGKWIRPKKDMKDVCPVFRRTWCRSGNIKKAELVLTAQGVYEAVLNGKKVGDGVLAPGWTSYRKRLQYQTYDISELLEERNELLVSVGKGWFRSPMPGFAESPDKEWRKKQPAGLFGEIRFYMEDGAVTVLPVDKTWECGESAVRFSEIYDGETYDARFVTKDWEPAVEFESEAGLLIPQEGEIIKEQERVEAKRIFVTPAGEVVVDFGQEVTGYVEFTVDADDGEMIRILHGEMLDAEGNFYRGNYRSAKAEIHYICRQGRQTWHPVHTFFGFRYLKLEAFPGEAKPEQFTAIAVYSDLKRTGSIRCSDPELNQLISNIFWGQKGNFLDVPTDCPQRDERLGWTGDAQVFVKTASYNYDVEKFFTKWLKDLAADQMESGAVPNVIPDWLADGSTSAGWGDAAVICPWQIYLTYGDPQILKNQFGSMKKWVDYITGVTKQPYLWIGGEHFGDWLGLDAPQGSYKGSTREDFIATVFYAHSIDLVVKAGKVLGENVSAYEELYGKVVENFRKTFSDYRTQTEYTLAVWFGMEEDAQSAADELAKLIKEDGCRLQTGFMGTPYLLHVLSRYGHTELAYTLLLRREYPSWLYAVQKGATTVWEHWDGIMEDGSMWSADMNSFNHYAYGAVADWLYEEVAGIRQTEDSAGFSGIRIEPKPDRSLEWLEAVIDTRQGTVRSGWKWTGERVRYEIETPVRTQIMIDGRSRIVGPGRYVLWSGTQMCEEPLQVTCI